MLKQILSKMKGHKGPVAAVGTAVSALLGGVTSQVPEIRTIAFFLLLEMIVLAILISLSKIAYYLQTHRPADNRYPVLWRRAVGNFVLGLHLAAGLVVLGVYFTV